MSVRHFIENSILPMLQRKWQQDRWTHHLETALLFCQEDQIPPPPWLTDAVADAFQDRKTDQAKLGRRLQKHGHRHFLVWYLMHIEKRTVEAACEDVADYETKRGGRPVTDEAVRKSYQREAAKVKKDRLLFP